MENTREILAVAVEMGQAMLENGGEIYRVEYKIKYVLEAYHIEDYNVFIISNGIFVSVNEGKEDMYSAIRHVPESSVHLARVAALNQLSREICQKEYSMEETRRRLEQCKSMPDYSSAKQVIACGVGCGGFCYLFGGRPLDMVITFFIGAFLRCMILFAGKYKISGMIVNLLGSFLTTAVSFLMVWTGLPVLQDKIVIGSIMALIPGITFNTAIRDILNADYISGMIHLLDALLCAMEIAVGVGAMFALYEVITGITFGV
jgi:uncharacterized membrane protein YjjP (DUF1212 family)